MAIFKQFLGFYIFAVFWTITLQRSFDLRNYNNLYKRASFADGVSLWPDGIIPYDIDTAFDQARQTMIDEALQEINQFSCVQFVKSGTSEYSQYADGGIVYFQKSDICNSCVGKAVVAGYHTVHLTDNCAIAGNYILHETLHVLGMRHEHQREDRSAYIKVQTENIDETRLDEFDMDQGSDLRFKYDISSLMQYPGACYLKEEGLKAMIPQALILEKPDPYDNLGGSCRWKQFNQGFLSHRDRATANYLYDCAAGCTAKACVNGGYQDSSCDCQCPQYLSGDLCETFAPNKTIHKKGECGEIDLSIPASTDEEPAILNPPQMEGSNNQFWIGKKCFWRITAAENQIVRVKFSRFKLDQEEGPGTKDDGECDYPNGDLLYIHLYGLDVSTYHIQCAQKDTFINKWAYSDSNIVYIQWNTTQIKENLFSPLTGSYTRTLKYADNSGWQLKYQVGALDGDGKFVVGGSG